MTAICRPCNKRGRSVSEHTAFHRELRQVLRDREAKWRLAVLAGVLLLAVPAAFWLGTLIAGWTS